MKNIAFLLFFFAGLCFIPLNYLSSQSCPGEVLNISTLNPSQTGTIGSWTVPGGGPYKVRITAKGAKGGDYLTFFNTSFPGGSGAVISGEFIVTSSQVLQGVAGAPGQNSQFYPSAGGGGGGSGVQIAGSSILVIAGAGGGRQFVNPSQINANLDTDGFGGLNFGNLNSSLGGAGGSNGNGGGGGFLNFVSGSGGGGGAFSGGGDGGTPISEGGGSGYNASGGSGSITFGGGGFGGGGGTSNTGGGGGGGGYSGGGGGGTESGGGGGSFNLGNNQTGIVNNLAGGQVIIECLGAAVFTADFTPTQPDCINPTLGSLNIDLTGDNEGNTAGLEYAIVSGSSFTGNPTFADITADPFAITSGFGTLADADGETYTVRIRLKYNPGIYIDHTYTLTEFVDNILYVNDNASGANNGFSWTNAFNSLQDALAAAASCSNVTEIWVAGGTYFPDQGIGYTPGDRSHSFVMQNNLAIYGGFPGLPGQEGDFDFRNPAAYPTRLSGDIGTAGNDSDNSYHVVYNFQNGLNDTAILDGFTITGGNANGGGFDTRGGGMYNSFVSPLIVNCIFTVNQADLGGGVYNSNPSTPTFVNCLFFSNTATSGSGALNDIASARYVNCTFSAHPGFALSNVDATPVLANCIIWGNGGGISNSGSGSNVAGVTYSIVQGGYSGAGNLNENPLFVAPANGDYRLQEGSPAIDAGNNAEIPLGILNDLGGNPRILQSTVDMGAFEYNSNIPTMGQWAFLLFGLGVFTLMIVSLWNVRRVNG